MANPGFPRWRMPTPEFGVKTYYLTRLFAENCMKMKNWQPFGSANGWAVLAVVGIEGVI